MRVSIGGSGPIFKWESVGQRLEGTFLGLRDGKQFPGQPQKSKLLDLKQSDGKQISAGAPTALAGRLSSVPVGAYVYIEYLGKQRGQAGVEFKNFNVEMEVPDDAAGSAPPATALQGAAALEQKLRDAKGAQVANLMRDALMVKYPDTAAYEQALRELLAAHGVQA